MENMKLGSKIFGFGVVGKFGIGIGIGVGLHSDCEGNEAVLRQRIGLRGETQLGQHNFRPKGFRVPNASGTCPS